VSSSAGIAGAVAGGALAQMLGMPQMFRLVAALMLVVAGAVAVVTLRAARRQETAQAGV
jgi:uncharacterized membrane protein YeaQ/YmgE (transglycosylase-associated protein family)